MNGRTWPKNQTLTVGIDQKTNEYDQNNNNKIKSFRRQTWKGEYDQNNKNVTKSLIRQTWTVE